MLAPELTSCGSMQSCNNLFKVKSCGHKHIAAGLGGGEGRGGEGRGDLWACYLWKLFRLDARKSLLTPFFGKQDFTSYYYNISTS